jgi:hypothetical protein
VKLHFQLTSIARAARRVRVPLAVMSLSLAVPAAWGQTNLGPITVGAGLRTSFVHTNVKNGTDTNTFPLDSIRLYVNGPVTSKVKLMFNTEYNSADNRVNVLDAVARLEVSPKFNIWAGRLLPGSDRANLAGPYYNNHWNVYSDGIQNGHPFVFQGRDNGVTYWGDFGKLKLSAGAFDGKTATGRANVLGAFRAQYHFWEKEDGYYLNSTYYGAKKLLTVGLANQVQDGRTATTADFLMERKVGAGVITLEGEYANYNRLGGYDAAYAKSEGGYGLIAYILPKSFGAGRLQLLAKSGVADFSKGGKAANYSQKTTEVNVNYLFKEFNGRFHTFFKKNTFDKARPDTWQIGAGIQIQL